MKLNWNFFLGEGRGKTKTFHGGGVLDISWNFTLSTKWLFVHLFQITLELILEMLVLQPCLSLK